MHEAENIGLGALGGVSYDGKIAGLYDLEETLGSGHFAVVKLARHVFTGAKVAVKVVDKTKLDEVSKAHLFQEVRCMKLVQHPNVVRLYEVIDTQTKLYLVLELGDGGDLYDYIMKHERGLNEELSKKYFRQIVRAISYCHELHVVHRDLKPENVVFFEKQDVVKLTDFGFSNKFSPGQKLETSCGSLAYSAPEILLGDSYDAPAVDIWSLGVILYMLVCGQAPFEKANDSETLIMIMDCKYTVPPHITPECRNLIGTMLVRDPVKRATLDEISKNPWLQPSTINDNIEYHLPLVSRQELSEEDHAFIIQKMINGKIASKEEIIKSLDKNQYNHITATYFLLGEIRLRKHREEQLQKRYPQKCIPTSSSRSHNMNSQCLNQNIKLFTKDSIHRCSKTHVGDITHDKRIRKCSIVREEDEDESLYEYSVDKYEMTTRRESVSDGRLSESILDRTNSIVPKVLYNNPGLKVSASVEADVTEEKFNRTGKKEGAIVVPISKTNCDEKFKVSTEPFVNETLCGIKSLKINRMKHLNTTSKNPVLTHRKVKLNKIRTPSCSSSETSDDDTKSIRKKKINKVVGDYPNRFRMHRRDSHDDSSDSQDQTTLPSSSASYSTRNLINSSSTNPKDSKGEPHRDKEKNKTEYTRKSPKSHSKQKKHIREQQKQTQTDNCSFVVNIQRRRIREIQSIDRITKVQEYEQRCLYTPSCNFPSIETNIQQGNLMYNFYLISFAKIRGYDEQQDLEENIFLVNQNRESKYQLEINKIVDILKLNSFDEIDLIICVNSFTKVHEVASYKCSSL